MSHWKRECVDMPVLGRLRDRTLMAHGNDETITQQFHACGNDVRFRSLTSERSTPFPLIITIEPSFDLRLRTRQELIPLMIGARLLVLKSCIVTSCVSCVHSFQLDDDVREPRKLRILRQPYMSGSVGHLHAGWDHQHSILWYFKTSRTK